VAQRAGGPDYDRGVDELGRGLWLLPYVEDERPRGRHKGAVRKMFCPERA